jgi:hypothetical protein
VRHRAINTDGPVNYKNNSRDRQVQPYRWSSAHGPGLVHLKRPNPLGLKCDTITSLRRLVNTFIHQIVPDILKRDKPIKVAINFKSWSTTRDISSEWG